jgi:lysophospholipase L1-like esterase
MNLPNLAVAPYVSSASATEKGILQRIAVGLTDRINALSANNVVVVDLMCEPRIYSGANYSSDGFHPSDSGYALMADLLYPALRNGTASAPSSNCAQRSAVPAF